MKTIQWHILLNPAGCKASGTLEVADDATEEDIENNVKEAALQEVEWWHEEVE